MPRLIAAGIIIRASWPPPITPTIIRAPYYYYWSFPPSQDTAW
jgi:hypothetical protein